MKAKDPRERRSKLRFTLQRQLRYKLMESDRVVEIGQGVTVDVSSGGIAFRTNGPLSIGDYIELSVDWPVLIDNTCPMRLVTFGKLVRRNKCNVGCTVEKWEFRTGSRQVAAPVVPMSTDGRLLRWVEYRKDVMVKTANSSAIA